MLDPSIVRSASALLSLAVFALPSGGTFSRHGPQCAGALRTRRSRTITAICDHGPASRETVLGIDFRPVD